ncbi:MAG: helix-turn-helix transcriptional regulator [Deltaproteobacteria bacterium]|nr:helix-turn-helix transcriptional regulator [Deltaproteobacteria bacterium]
MTPGAMLKTLRQLQGYSQNELAKITGIAQGNISNMEKSHQQIGRERALTLAKALKVHPAILLFPNYEIEYKKAA